MHTQHRTPLFIPLLVLVVLLLASLACGSSASSSTSSISASNTGDSSSTLDHPANTPEPPAAPTAAPAGISRSNPLPATQLVQAPNWDFQVMEVKRGDAAWQDLQAANMFNTPAPAGMEYLLVKIHAKSTYADSEEHEISGCDFDVTGDRLVKYSCGTSNVVPPEPVLDAQLFTGGETEGWEAFMVAQGETNLMLVFSEMMNFDPGAMRIVALDNGASLSVPAELAGIQPSGSGTDRNAPAPKAEKLVTDNWEISVLDVIRGADAWNMIQAANEFNEAPQTGFEYVLAKVHARYIGTEDRAEMLDGTYFQSTGSAGILHDHPAVVAPAPELTASLYPGGEYEGWVVLQATQGETGMTLVFEPLLDFGGNKRFISLEQ